MVIEETLRDLLEAIDSGDRVNACDAVNDLLMHQQNEFGDRRQHPMIISGHSGWWALYGPDREPITVVPA